jgi:hypothetical protein
MLDDHPNGHGRTDTALVLLAGILRAEIIGSEPRTSALPVADVIDAWRASEEGPCVRCRARTQVYGQRGHPLCADCRPPETVATARLAPAARTSYERKTSPSAARAIRRGAA